MRRSSVWRWLALAVWIAAVPVLASQNGAKTSPTFIRQAPFLQGTFARIPRGAASPYAPQLAARVDEFLAGAEPTAEGLAQYLAPMQLIRIAVPSAPGNGHQAVGATIAKRLRELGFKGQFEILYDGLIKDKLDLTLPGFDPEGPYKQSLPVLGARTLAVKNGTLMDLPKADLGISASNGFMSGQLRAETELRVGPYAWEFPTVTSGANGVTKHFPELHDYLFSFAPPRPSNVEKFLSESLSGSTRLREKIGGLQALERHRQRVELLPAYGLSDVGDEGKVGALLKAVSAAQDLAGDFFRSGVVIPFFSYLNGDSLERLQASLLTSSISERVKMVSVRDAGAVESALSALAPGQILLLRVGGVSQDVFEYFFSRQTLPGTMAGANGQNLMRVLGLPFLLTVDKETEGLKEISRRLPDPERSLLEEAGRVLRGDSADAQPLARFLLEGRNPDSTISRAFAAAKPSELKHDKLAVLLALAARLRRQAEKKAAGFWSSLRL